MPTPFIMPKMDMDQETVVINEWLKNEGDQVEKGEPVIVIETDKITSEVEAPASGRLAGVLYGDNEEVPVTQVIAYILAKDETEADLPEQPGKKEPVFVDAMPQAEPTVKSEKAQKSVTPVAKRMAEANNIDLEQVPSAGDKITKEDIESYLESLEQIMPRVETPATPAARRLAMDAKVPLDQIEGTGPRGRVQADDVNAFVAHSAERLIPQKAVVTIGERLPLSRIRKRIADRMTASYQSTPHIFLTVEVDMHEAEQSRKRMNQLAAEPNISLTAYLVRIVAWALKRHPFLNAGFEDDQIKLWQEVNIGVATAIDEGLIVPVIHNADQKSIREISQRLRYLTEQARAGALIREEIQDGTFTISNLGMYGIQNFTAIINPPQSAILAVGTIQRKPVVIDDADTIQVRPMMMMTLGADHRVIDGAVAAAFLAELAGALETPEVLLM
jgi:pyruvate dehydrogenase E2 component (dihydrolipoamide acetyltransferase)